eukprot:CAMPEP_0172368468 /NCGR_PEP_ID=MMETSP1060-20121228/27329_1 /TAXON_ID=37318 /ORGANISM="Pseudo-nitzschia pungens, Strain cf. cingulata" /LENGTH=335 /DNA_ID=CAMNT_0013093071 /DNA_START=126 /DNA_END=1133 /DNA_ORIENTATION=+
MRPSPAPLRIIFLALLFPVKVVLSFRQSGLPSLSNRSAASTCRRRPKTTNTHQETRLSSSSLLETPTPRNRRLRQPFTQVISDVDDTLKSSGGVNVGGIALGGIDVQYERSDFYPGVGEFMLEMSRYGLPEEDARCPAKIAILTARAEEFKAALEIKDESKLAVALRSAGEKAGVEGWGVGPVLYGSVAEWIVQDRKGLRKFTNFERLMQQDPTGMIFQYVYVGDVGELDQEAGETMLREYPEIVKGVFLHVVTDEAGVSPIVPPPKFINGRPLVFFRTYVGAAVDAVRLGMMGLDGLTSVIQAAKEKLSDVPETSDKWVDIRRDLARAEVLFQI